MEFNPFAPEFKADPYAVYAELRENAPVLQTAMGFWAVSRYDDVCYVLKNAPLFSSRPMGLQSMGVDGRGTRSIISSDPPDHTMLRNLVNRAFTPKMVAEMEPRIREITSGLLDRVVASGRMDLVDDLAMPLPVTIIAEILGVEPLRRDDFKRWSNAVVANPTEPVDGNGTRAADVAEFRAFFADVTAERRREPKSDLISAIVRAEEDNETLTNDEIIGFAMLLLIAGNETTTNLLGNAMLALLKNPDEMQRLRDDRSLIPNLVEEALRYDSPVQFLFRTTTQDVEIGETRVPAGAPIVPIYASANRDDRRYPDGARFDVTRNAQGHVAFGLGPHFCLGAPLARLEAKVAFEELLNRCDDIEMAGEPERLESLFLRGMRKLPLGFTATVQAR
jgi:cytochrome P450